MKTRALVMGGSYFIGKMIVNALNDNNYEVYVLNRGSKQPDDKRAHQIIADRNDAYRLKSALKDVPFDIVIDVSGLNQYQSKLLCEAIDDKLVKTFIYISSSSVYDVEHLTIPYKEMDKLGENRFWTEYGINKIEAERFYTEYFSERDTDLIILRPPYVYGEGNYVQRESFVFNHIRYEKPIILPISNCKLQFIYSKDLANTVISLLNYPLPKISVFNIGNQNSITVLEWVEICAQIMNKPAKIVLYDYIKDGIIVRDFFPFHDYDNVLNISKIRSICLLETPLEIGLKASYEWYLENESIIEFKESVMKNEREILKRLGII